MGGTVTRAVVAVVCAALVLVGCTPEEVAPAVSPPPGTVTPTQDGGASASPDLEDRQAEARTLLTDVRAAAGIADGDQLRAAVAALLPADFDGLVAPSWTATVREGLPAWPIMTGEATLGLDGAVALDVVLAAPPDPDGTLVLRWLPAATALGDAVTSIAVTVDGEAVEVEQDGVGARLLVPVPTNASVVVRVAATYVVPPRIDIADDGSPAGYGLLARTPEALMLGHWLPLPTLATDDGPMETRGDVGGFPAGAFSIVVHHDGTLVSGGEERDCPQPADGCSWLQGIGLRDLAVVLLANATTVSATTAHGVQAVAHVPAGALVAAAVEAVAQEAADGLATLTAAFGELPWPAVDVVGAPLEPGALGMEFPGIVWVDPGAWPETDADLGSYVLAHELGHQWFHALVGNGSLSAPVVDESLAQYTSVLVFDALFGDGAGARLAARSLGGRHARALDDGVPDDRPAQPLGAFSTDRSYGASVYGRAGQAWVDAEAAAGRAAVVAALRVLVSRHGLREVDERTVVDLLREQVPGAVDAIVTGWGMSG